jgi:hypothetical protein
MQLRTTPPCSRRVPVTVTSSIGSSVGWGASFADSSAKAHVTRDVATQVSIDLQPKTVGSCTAYLS